MWALAANWHRKNNNKQTKKTHTKIYTKQQQKMCILGLVTMAKEGGGVAGGGGGGSRERGTGWGMQESLITFWGTSLC